MRLLIASLVLLVAGCANYTSIVELEDRYFQCTRDQAVGCDAIAAELDAAYEREKRREAKEQKRIHDRCNAAGNRCFWMRTEK